MFNKNSGLVQIWIRLLSNNSNNYTTQDIPNISNLKKIILEELSKKE